VIDAQEPSGPGHALGCLDEPAGAVPPSLRLMPASQGARGPLGVLLADHDRGPDRAHVPDAPGAAGPRVPVVAVRARRPRARVLVVLVATLRRAAAGACPPPARRPVLVRLTGEPAVLGEVLTDPARILRPQAGVIVDAGAGQPVPTALLRVRVLDAVGPHDR